MDPPATPGPALVVHAGAWAIPEGEREAHRSGCVRASIAGWDVLQGGGAAVEAVQTAIQVMEDDEALNAGRGSVLCDGGWVELDAGLMDGTRLDAGAVACVPDVENPIRLAAALLEAPEVLLVGAGASAFARRHGVPTCRPEALVVSRERSRLAAWRASGRHEGPADTVGAVALDVRGHLAAGTSTGGRPGKPSGRVGDAPVPGCGFYADDAAGAAVSTGWGEDVLRMGLARRAVDLARDHVAQDACWLAIREMESRITGRAGVILVGRDGSMGYAFNTPAMAVAYRDRSLAEPVVGGLGSP